MITKQLAEKLYRTMCEIREFELAASRDYTVPPNGAGPQTFRFATMEDLEAELAWRTKDAAAPFVGAYW